MSRRLFRALCAALCVVLSSALMSAPALAGKKRADATPAGSLAVSQPSAGEILCPATAAIGEPFVARLKLARPASKAELTFMGRSAPLVLRKSGAGMEAAIILGADVLDGRPGRQDITVRVTPALSTEGAKGGKPLTLRTGVELVKIKRPVERLTLDPAMVNPPDAELPRITRERAQTRQTLGLASAQRLWSLPFSRPAQGGLSSEYGIGRVLNGEPKSPHRGLDLEAETGDPVTAAADGVVALAGAFYYAGNCVYLDHGQGLLTMYFHLSEVRVAPGMRVARGQLLGLAGETGRSTRSHLHFGVSALGRLVDPAPLFLYDALP
ncbi:MAG TPA: M23 family metallopeptidase [Humidesulfovibrio sp.]|uniref:M23 family metallopeptidase n=1 Tax=Humidesulfovibrio sp. TaxID=2910988 RepID=UPI002C4E87F8|nr:M23 family metallopeptidase [Humidesulfovibrio sp.]HWR04010.1 M23 family metallopeptidase [Humidesulfovibrio sp.]